MKRIWMLIAILGFAVPVMSQTTDDTHTYLEIQDDPTFIPDKIVSLELCGPVSFSKYAELTMGVGANALWGIGSKLDVIGSFDFNFIQMNGGMGVALEGGPAFTFGQKTKEKEVKVVLKYSDRSYETATTRVRETSATWLNASAPVLNKYKLRGGAYVLKTSYENEKDYNYGKLPLTMAGVYGGLEFSTQAALVSEVDGVKGITGGLTRFYLDAFVLPLRSFGSTDVGGTIRSTIGGGFLGGRVGFQAMFNPNKSKKSSLGRLVN
ncbi:MAG TPA: hypothetical protein VHS96_07955, partial [Bacteroidia bacterium]|nr:hypothetical protein [Bacteroidia bacterium]